MAATVLQDIVFNNAFALYFHRAVTELSALVQSGIAAADPRIAALCAEAGFGGKTVNLPFWNALDGDDEVTPDGGDIGVSPLTAGQDVAVILRRSKAWGVTDLAVEIAGDDPMKTLADKLANYWNRRRQKALFAQLTGVFANNVAKNDSDLVLDISGETGDDALLSKDTLLYAAQLLGDAKGGLTAIAMHSMCETALNVGNTGNLFKPADSPATLPTYNGRKIVMDDGCPYNPTTKVADIYLFGAGAVALNPVPSRRPFEVGRSPLSSTDLVVSRQAWISHLRGIKWNPAQGVPAKPTPSNAELADGSNWDRVYSKKEIRVVKLRCKLAAS